MDVMSRLFVNLHAAPGRALAFELACVAPAMLLLSLGGYAWGGYFWLDHQVQRAADVALAAASQIAEPGRRDRAARAAVQAMLPLRAEVTLEARAGRLTAAVACDASGTAVFLVQKLLAPPPPLIVRVASTPN
jgi:hypothetical protein